MANPKEIARIAADEKRQARIREVALQLRDAAQGEYDAAVAEHTALIEGFPEQLQEIDRRSSSAYARRDAAAAAHAETAGALDAARIECDTIDEERRAATHEHLAATDRSRQDIAARAPQLSIEHWLERAAKQVADE